MTTGSHTSTAFETYKSTIATVGIPLVVAALGGLGMWMSKVDQRQYELQGNIVRPADLEKVEERIVKSMDVRLTALEKLMKTTMDSVMESQRRLEDKMYGTKKE